MRVEVHPVLGKRKRKRRAVIEFDGKRIEAEKGEPIAAALMAAGISIFSYTKKNNAPRGLFCAIGRCSDCSMIVNGIANTRACVTPVKAGMKIETQHGVGEWKINQ